MKSTLPSVFASRIFFLFCKSDKFLEFGGVSRPGFFYENGFMREQSAPRVWIQIRMRSNNKKSINGKILLREFRKVDSAVLPGNPLPNFFVRVYDYRKRGAR